MSWGKGWEVGIRKAMWQQGQAQRIAARILAEEHGIKHQNGERALCPKCVAEHKRTQESQ